MKYIQLSLLISLISICLACNDQLELQNDAVLSEEEKEVLEDCQAQFIPTAKQIEENLIGSWELVGYACSSCSYSKSPNATIDFQPKVGRYRYKDEFEEIDKPFTWEIKVLRFSFREPVLFLETDPVLPGLFADFFCQNYLGTDRIDSDGSMFIYAKQ